MSTLKTLREVKACVESLGGRLLDHRYSKHLKVRVDFGHGPRLIVVSISPSDGRAMANIKRDILRAKALQ